jgi:hypothetical protein
MPLIKLTVDTDKARECVQFSYRIMQSVDYSTGRPATNVAPLELNASFYSMPDDSFFWTQARKPTQKVKGKLEIMDSDDIEKVLKTLSFEEGIVTAYSETGSGTSSEETVESITIIARISDVNNGSKHEVEWKRGQ